MSVIRWEEDADGKWQGHLGWSHVATAGLYTAPDGSDVFALTTREEFPGFKEFVDPYESIDACKDGAEELIQEWMGAAGLVQKPGIEIARLRPAALKPYQEAFLQEMIAGEHEAVTVTVPSNGSSTYQRGVDSYMAKLTVDRLKEMAEQIDTAAAATAELNRRAEAFADWAMERDIPFTHKVDPEACCRRVIGPDGLWMWEVGGAA